MLVCALASSTITNQTDSLCGKGDCELTSKKGVWICCMCRFGYKGSDRNRYGQCSSCDHNVCEDCKEWNSENVAAMEAEDEVDMVEVESAANSINADTN